MRSCLQMFGDLARVLVAVPRLEFLLPDRIYVMQPGMADWVELWCHWALGWFLALPLSSYEALGELLNLSESQWFFFFFISKKSYSQRSQWDNICEAPITKKIWETLKIRNLSLYSVLRVWLAFVTRLTMLTWCGGRNGTHWGVRRPVGIEMELHLK